MKVAFDISPTRTEHRLRGIGSYTQKLVQEFQNDDLKIDIEFFDTPASPPPADVVHYPYFDLFFHTLPIKKGSSRVVTIHDVIPLVFPNNFPVGIRGYLNLFQQKRALQNTDFVICDSKASRDDIVNKLSYPKDKIKVIHLAPGENFRQEINESRFKEISKKFHLPKKFALYVGDVNWNKNLEGLIRSIKISGVDLVMIGAALKDRNIAETKAINKLIEKLNLDKNVHKLGFVDEEDLVAIYNLATLTILPSYYEGFGLPVLESLACGTPVVCSNVASLSEIAGETAFFCDPSDPNNIAEVTVHVLNLKKEKRQALGTKGIKHAASFSWHKVARETSDVYKMLHEQKS